MKVMRNRAAKTLTLSNPGHTATLLEAFGMDKATPNKTPMASRVKLNKTGEGLLPEGNRYAELVGSLLFLVTTTRPDIAFAVGVLSRFLSCPEEDHMRAAKEVLRHLCGTTRLGVVYSGSEPLQGFVDADWAGDIDGRRSTTACVFTCNGGAIAWASKRQSTVATSTAETEYVAAAMATKEALWLRKLLSALGVDGGAVAMGEDNQSCLALVNNPETTGRTKHVDVAYHMVRDYQVRDLSPTLPGARSFANIRDREKKRPSRSHRLGRNRLDLLGALGLQLPVSRADFGRVKSTSAEIAKITIDMKQTSR